MTKTTLCKAVTATGEQCKIKPGESGYCHIHDPKKILERNKRKESEKTRRKEAWGKGKKLREALEVIQSTARAAGWTCYTENVDEENWRYATVNVSRFVSSKDVKGFFEIVVDGGVRFTMNQTSFYGHGLSLLSDSIKEELSKLSWLEPKKKQSEEKVNNDINKVMELIHSFHDVARQLKRRHDDRETLIIRDEYDVQDLLQALLKTIYDDIRPEESTPSYAGASSRIDFLLKKEQIVIEVKMSSPTLKDKTIGEQLIVDIKRYQTHPDCKKLVCFVYDPDNHVKNPIALESDLSGKHDSIDVFVLVVPH